MFTGKFSLQFTVGSNDLRQESQLKMALIK